MTGLLLQPIAPASMCDVCGAWPLNHCIALDGTPLAVPHRERTETTPIHDALLVASSTNSLPSRRRADAGTPTVNRPALDSCAGVTRSGSSTRAPQPPAGQGTLVAAGGARA